MDDRAQNGTTRGQCSDLFRRKGHGVDYLGGLVSHRVISHKEDKKYKKLEGFFVLFVLLVASLDWCKTLLMR
ncbi:MAG TPA: hypothetical protein DDW52_26280 [Planctomycetaceae bacterium]|nr:hypothetical protein [Planctomycetaceae bacterium]